MRTRSCACETRRLSRSSVRIDNKSDSLDVIYFVSSRLKIKVPIYDLKLFIKSYLRRCLRNINQGGKKAPAKVYDGTKPRFYHHVLIVNPWTIVQPHKTVDKWSVSNSVVMWRNTSHNRGFFFFNKHRVLRDASRRGVKEETSRSEIEVSRIPKLFWLARPSENQINSSGM